MCSCQKPDLRETVSSDDKKVGGGEGGVEHGYVWKAFTSYDVQKSGTKVAEFNNLFLKQLMWYHWLISQCFCSTSEEQVVKATGRLTVQGLWEIVGKNPEIDLQSPRAGEIRVK